MHASREARSCCVNGSTLVTFSHLHVLPNTRDTHAALVETCMSVRLGVVRWTELQAASGERGPLSYRRAHQCSAVSAWTPNGEVVFHLHMNLTYFDYISCR
jgi:hypothetical protein